MMDGVRQEQSTCALHTEAPGTFVMRISARSALRGLPTGLSVLLALMVAGCGEDPSDRGSGPAGPEHPIASATRTVVYASGTEEQFHLWLMANDGAASVQLTYGDGFEVGPVWSPDGSRIAFLAANDMDHDFDLWVIDADGTGLRQLTDTENVWEGVPSWSADGQHVAYSHSVGALDEGGEVRV